MTLGHVRDDWGVFGPLGMQTDAHGQIAYSLRLANGLNLDRRQMVLEAFDRLEAACGA